ncbi:MAG: DUF5808 domain-containing protein [Candidatus Acidiferrales bacterium]
MTGHSQLFYFCGILVLLGVVEAGIFWMAPLWERPGLFFAVTVPPEFRSSPDGRKILRRYRALAIVLIAIGWGFILAGETPKRWPLLVLGVAWLAFGPLIAFLIAREAVLPHAAQAAIVQELMEAPRAAHLPGGWLLQIGPFAILAATAIYLRMHWERIPEIFPVHWGLDGLANGWSVRTLMGVYGPLIIGAAMVAGLALVTYGVLREARVIRIPGARRHGRDFPHQVGYFLAGIEYLLAVTLSSVALLPLLGGLNVGFVLLIAILVIAVAFVGTYWLNQTRARVVNPAALSTPRGIFGDGTLDDHWKAGIFYFNPNDPALFVEKRFGFGYTLNYAHGVAWVVTALIALVPVAMAFAAIFRSG